MIYTYNPGEVYKQAGFLQQLGGAVGWGALPASQAQEGSSLVASTQPEIGWKAEFLVWEWGFAKGAKEERRVIPQFLFLAPPGLAYASWTNLGEGCTCSFGRPC